MERNARVLVVDDEPDMLDVCSRVLTEEGYDVKTASAGSQAVDIMYKEPFDIVLLDLKMPDMSGVAVLGKIREIDPTTVVLLVTAHPSVDTAVKSLKMGAFNYVIKPLSGDDLKRAVSEALHERVTAEENLIFKKVVAGFSPNDAIVGKAEPVLKLIEGIRRVASSDCNLLIFGETGTGKSDVAHAVHDQSPRSFNPFVAVDCSILNEAMADREIPSLVEQAAGGTVYLRQFTDLPVRIQALIESIIGHQEIERKAGHSAVSAKVRFIASTAENPIHLVEQKKIYQNLFYALNQFLLMVPPLRERAEDIPVLATKLLIESREKHQKFVEGFSLDAIAVLKNHKWPGNLKELRNVVESAFLVTKGPYIQVKDLPQSLREESEQASDDSANYREQKLAASREYLDGLLKKHNGNITHASAEAGIHRSTLQRLLRRHGIDATAYRG